MTGMTVHQGFVLLEADLFKGVQYAHFRLDLEGKILKLGGVDVVRFVSQNPEFKNSANQLNGLPFEVVALRLLAITLCLCSNEQVYGD